MFRKNKMFDSFDDIYVLFVAIVFFGQIGLMVYDWIK